jgi:hypothetical protein
MVSRGEQEQATLGSPVRMLLVPGRVAYQLASRRVGADDNDVEVLEVTAVLEVEVPGVGQPGAVGWPGGLSAIWAQKRAYKCSAKQRSIAPTAPAMLVHQTIVRWMSSTA